MGVLRRKKEKTGGKSEGCGKEIATGCGGDKGGLVCPNLEFVLDFGVGDVEGELLRKEHFSLCKRRS
jgi:hypothetical protein